MDSTKSQLNTFRRWSWKTRDTGERTSLLDKVMGSVSNPKIARHELMVRMRGFEDMANEMGLVGMFYVDRTVTLSRHTCAFRQAQR